MIFVCLKPVGGLRCASACSRAFRVGVCLLPPFFWVVCAANIQLFLYCCNGFGAKAFMRGRFFVVRANGLRALACRKRTKLWRASGCVNKRKVRAFPSVCVTHWFTACCVTGRFALQNGSFWAAKRAVSGGETARFGKRNGRRWLAAWPHYGLLTVSAILVLASFVHVLPRREAGGCAEVFGEEGGVGEVEPVAHLLHGV